MDRYQFRNWAATMGGFASLAALAAWANHEARFACCVGGSAYLYAGVIAWMDAALLRDRSRLPHVRWALAAALIAIPIAAIYFAGPLAHYFRCPI